MPSETIHTSLCAQRIAQIKDAQIGWENHALSLERQKVIFADKSTCTDNQIKQARDVVKAYDLELQTGKPHCSCCFKPIAVHDHALRL